MIHSRGAQASDAEVVWTQILQGMGGGFASVCSTVASQAAVPHVDMAMTTAMVLLWTEIGGGVGSALAGAIWTNTMPDKLAAHLPNVDPDTRAQLFGSITSITALPYDDPTRQGAIAGECFPPFPSPPLRRRGDGTLTYGANEQHTAT